MNELYALSYSLLNKYVKLKRLLWHAYASGAIMKDLAEYLNEDIDKRGFVGVIKIIDLDVESVYKCLLDNDFAKHFGKTPILEYEYLNIEIKAFIIIGVDAMKKASNKIGFNN